MRRKRLQPERDLHCALVQLLKLKVKAGVLWWHTPNGGHRHPATAKLMKKMGTLAGVPDLLFFHKGSPLLGLELKAKGTSLSPSQQAYRKMLEQNGGIYEVTDNIDGALSFLSHGGILK